MLKFGLVDAALIATMRSYVVLILIMALSATIEASHAFLFRTHVFGRSSMVSRQNMVSSGFSFSDGEQLLVSAQKPLGIILEQDSTSGVITVAEVDPNGSAGKGGVRVGDVLVAVQNASTENVDLDSVLDFIGKGPRVINLRVLRARL